MNNWSGKTLYSRDSQNEKEDDTSNQFDENRLLFSSMRNNPKALCKLYLRHQVVVVNLISIYLHENPDETRRALQKYCQISKRSVEEVRKDTLSLISNLVDGDENNSEKEDGDVEEAEENSKQIFVYPEKLNFVLFPRGDFQPNNIPNVEKMTIDELEAQLRDGQNPYQVNPKRRKSSFRKIRKIGGECQKLGRCSRKLSPEDEKKWRELSNLADLINKAGNNLTLRANDQPIPVDTATEAFKAEERSALVSRKELSDAKDRHHEVVRLSPVDRSFPDLIAEKATRTNAILVAIPLLIILLFGISIFWYWKYRKSQKAKKSSRRKYQGEDEGTSEYEEEEEVDQPQLMRPPPLKECGEKLSRSKSYLEDYKETRLGKKTKQLFKGKKKSPS